VHAAEVGLLGVGLPPVMWLLRQECSRARAARLYAEGFEEAWSFVLASLADLVGVGKAACLEDVKGPLPSLPGLFQLPGSVLGVGGQADGLPPASAPKIPAQDMVTSAEVHLAAALRRPLKPRTHTTARPRQLPRCALMRGQSLSPRMVPRHRALLLPLLVLQVHCVAQPGT
jgi:hypothetical protein